ncbi:MAG: hypothetical protein H7839_20175, partial [Magnetococcus sp. YQC-5]
MENRSGEHSEEGDGSIPETIMQAINDIVARGYGYEQAQEIFRGDGCFLDQGQVAGLLKRLDEAAGMAQLAAMFAEHCQGDQHGREDIHVALLLVMEAVLAIGKTITENTAWNFSVMGYVQNIQS